MARDPWPALSGLLLFLAGLVGAARPVAAVPLLLDTTFGDRGTVLTDVGVDNVYLTQGGVEALGLQADGKLVVAGTSGGFVLARYHPDGGLDASFGAGGIVRTLIPALSGATALAVQPDGKIVAGGFWCEGSVYGCVNTTGGFALARYDTDGTLDASFGSGGTVATAPFSASLASVYALVIQPDGKLVAAGRGADKVALARYETDGTLDPGFGDGGMLTVSVGLASWARALALLPDGRLLMAGETFTFSSYDGGDFLLLRIHPDGSPDASFGVQGVVVTDLAGAHDEARALALLPSGKILVGGASSAPRTIDLFGLARYEADGTLDASFGTAGVVRTALDPPWYFDHEQVYALAVLPDDGIVAAGTSAGGYFGLVRYTPDGSLDPTFPSGGTLSKAMGSYADAAHAAALQPDGRLVVAGKGCAVPGVTDCQFALARYDLAPCDCPPCEHCDATGACVAAPQGGCRTAVDAGAPRLVVHRKDRPGEDRLAWRLGDGQLMRRPLFGDPGATDAYTLCLYDESETTPRVVFSATAPAGSSCEGGTCWRPGAPLRRRLEFRSDDGAPEGLTRLRLTAGRDGGASVLVEGKGAHLTAPILPLPLPLRVQLQGEHGQCWEARYTDAKRNDAGGFAAHGSP